MSKIHPHHLATPSQTPLSLDQPSTSHDPHSSSSSSSSSSTSNTQREIFTIWMKSLILGGKGCTVFDSKGQVIYRVDNYSSKCCDQVYLMDSKGHVLLTILRKVWIQKGIIVFSHLRWRCFIIYIYSFFVCGIFL